MPSMYCHGQTVLSKEGKENWDNIRWDEPPDQEFVDDKKDDEENNYVSSQ